VIGDTVVARASTPGPAARAVLRLSGPAARAAAARVFAPAIPGVRAQLDGSVVVRGRAVAAMVLSMPGPASFTGEDVVELHVPGSPLLLEVLQAELLRGGADLGLRAALPGEFTARAFQSGRLDAAQVEGLLLLLHAADRRESAAAMPWLQGGWSAAAEELRAGLQDALALAEVGLDFGDGDTGEVPDEAWAPRLPGLRERLAAMLAAVPVVAPGGEVLLLGRANAGKSSLANALAGAPRALVDGRAGTTRDLLRVELAPGAVLWDAPGDLDAPSAADREALDLRDRLGGRAASLLVVLDASAPELPPSALSSPLPWFGVVFTKCDLAAPPPLPAAARDRLPPGAVPFTTSARTGAGLDALRRALAATGEARAVDAGGPLRRALEASLQAIDRALAALPAGPEVVAVELQSALRSLDGIGGTHSAEDLLDRIYGRFCLGK
jgi:tRNA modification GTPase